MCTLALYYRVFSDYPLVVAANRDERFSRDSASPQRFDEKPLIFGGKDLVAGGTWLGVNERGLIAAVVNRRLRERGPTAGSRSRGLLCLEALKAKAMGEAFDRVGRENGASYQPFLLLVACADEAFVAYNSGAAVARARLEPGVHVFSNTSFADSTTEKSGNARELFSAAASPLRDQLTSFGRKDQRAEAEALTASVKLLQRILTNHDPPPGANDPRDSICVHGGDYGTVSSSIVFLAEAEGRFYFYHAPAAPCRGDYQALEGLTLV